MRFNTMLRITALLTLCLTMASCGTTAVPGPTATPEATTATPSPTPTPSPSPTPTPVPTPSPSPTPIPKPTPAPAFTETIQDTNPEHKWEPFPGSVDILILVAHPDDEQLYLGAVPPTYIQQGKSVVTVYMTCGYSEKTRKVRMQEALNGLYAVGERIYPVIGNFTDKLTHSLSEARKYWKEDEALGFLVEQVRKYKPSVIVTQDVNGEYGHGAHRFTAWLAQQVFTMSADANKYPDSARDYGTWQPAKLYLHLYKENPLVIDTKQPLSLYDGKTAFDVAKIGYNAHKSQHQWSFAVSRTKYSIEQFGLALSMVGYENTTNDMFENIGPDTMNGLNPR
jgi:LmbE family N-acetylglucosaminyl deacetylase